MRVKKVAKQLKLFHGHVTCDKEGYPDDELKKIADLLYNDEVKQLSKRKRNAIVFLYLRQAIEENISIQAAFEKYQYTEKRIDSNVHVCNGIEYGVYLVPRKHKMEFKMPYREAAFDLLEVIKDELHIKD